MYFNERLKLYNLQIYINIFYFSTYYAYHKRNNENYWIFWIGYLLKLNKMKVVVYCGNSYFELGC